MKEFVLVVNTVFSNKDIWEMFFNQLEKHFPNNKIYVFTDNADGLPKKVIPIIYNPNDFFRTQYLNSIKHVSEEYCIYLNEDYILYADVREDIINNYIKEMNLNKSISFIRLIRGNNFTNQKYNNYNDLYYLDINQDYFYSQNVTIWRTEDLKKIHELGPDLHIAGKRTYLQFETEANIICRNLNLIGLCCYFNEPKRGKYHYDSIVFPYIATAIVKGVWNLYEYFNELYPLLTKYNINSELRGSNI